MEASEWREGSSTPSFGESSDEGTFSLGSEIWCRNLLL
jgi:hypothetical protein